MSASAAVPLVKPESGLKRVLLLASEAVFESEVRKALERQLRQEKCSTCFELVYLDLTSLIDFLAVLDLLAYIRQGIFDSIHIFPPAATWSRSGHSGFPGRAPLRSRSAPLGLSHFHGLKMKRFALPTFFWKCWPGAPSKRFNTPARPLV